MFHLGTTRRFLGLVRVWISLAVVGSWATATHAQWPQWGGPQRDFEVKSAQVADDWPDDGPKKLWSRPLGEGYSSIVYDDNRLLTMHRAEDEEVIVALDPASGKTLWEYRYSAPMIEGIETRFGKGPNATPTVHGDLLYTLGITGKLHAIDKRSGNTTWSHDLVAEFGAKPPTFGFSSSPLVHGNRLIVAVGGEGVGMMSLDPATGAVIWKRHDFENIYSSPIVIDVDGQEQIVLLTDREIVGIAPEDGALKWRHEHVNQWKTNICTPVWGENNVLFLTSGGDAGSRALKLSRKGDSTHVKEIWSTRKLKVGQTNVIRMGDYIYGCSGERNASFMAALDAKTGELAWRERGFAKAMILAADGKFVILDEDGSLALAKATPTSFELLAQTPLLSKVAWTVPTIVGNRLFVRDKEQILALEIG